MEVKNCSLYLFLLVVVVGGGTPHGLDCILAHKPSQQKDISSTLKHIKSRPSLLYVFGTLTFRIMALNTEEENSMTAI